MRRGKEGRKSEEWGGKEGRVRRGKEGRKSEEGKEGRKSEEGEGRKEE